MKFQEKIKTLRLQGKMTQEAMAKSLLVSRKTVSSWENGRNYPDIKTLVKISDVFSISLDTLLREDQVMTDRLSELEKLSKKNLRIFKVSYGFMMVLTVLSYISSMTRFYPRNGWLVIFYVISVAICLTHFPLTDHQLREWFVSFDHLLLFVIILIGTGYLALQASFMATGESAYYLTGTIVGAIFGGLVRVVSVMAIVVFSPDRVLKMTATSLD
ncbi:helix-turn-helix transcriptional regulator [Levilactobacillus brevis]|uniref:helix-turn-helix transcriptional regulator n=1 Tax=Levilactobacillus brevis TaxID=1580 RepID=UPI0021A79039|nr:helix-turn-helix transcriptional regulator [Levilactobacillus brevis]